MTSLASWQRSQGSVLLAIASYGRARSTVQQLRALCTARTAPFRRGAIRVRDDIAVEVRLDLVLACRSCKMEDAGGEPRARDGQEQGSTSWRRFGGHQTVRPTGAGGLRHRAGGLLSFQRFCGRQRALPYRQACLPRSLGWSDTLSRVRCTFFQPSFQGASALTGLSSG